MVMVAVAIGALIWKPRLLTFTIVCLLVGIPVIGFGAYALQPAPVRFDLSDDRLWCADQRSSISAGSVS